MSTEWYTYLSHFFHWLFMCYNCGTAVSLIKQANSVSKDIDCSWEHIFITRIVGTKLFKEKKFRECQRKKNLILKRFWKIRRTKIGTTINSIIPKLCKLDSKQRMSGEVGQIGVRVTSSVCGVVVKCFLFRVCWFV